VFSPFFKRLGVCKMAASPSASRRSAPILFPIDLLGSFVAWLEARGVPGQFLEFRRALQKNFKL
jgi:hypothetical protein